MARKMEDCQINLIELPRKDPTSISYMIKIPNFFTMPENDGNADKMKSPSFKFDNALWRFIFEPGGYKDKIGRQFKKISVYLSRFHSELKHFVFYSILMLDADDFIHRLYYDKYIFDNKHKNNGHCMGIFIANNFFYDKRDNLTLIVHLICDELAEMNPVEEILFNEGAAKRKKESEISLLELPSRIVSSVYYSMVLPNFFNLSEYNDTKCKMKSKTFKFSKASWEFHFTPVKKENMTETEHPKSFGLYLVRLNSEERKHLISYTILFLDEDNKEFGKKCGKCLYKEDFNKVCMWKLIDSHGSYTRRNYLKLIFRLICDETPEDYADQELQRKIHREDFKSMLLNGQNHDLTLRVAEKEFQVHKDVLIARSPAFESVLSHEVTENTKSFIDIPDCDPQAMEQFLLYLYCTKVDTLNNDNALGLYDIAAKYKVALLKSQCSDFIKKSLSPSMICDVIKLSKQHSDTDLLEYATEYFLDHTHVIFPTSEWVSFLTGNVTTANELLIKASKKWKNTKR